MKALRGDRASRTNQNEPVPREASPEPPEWATESWLAIWERLRHELAPMGLWLSADRDAIVALVTTIDCCARVVVGAPAVIRGADGAPTHNPLGGEMRRLSAEVARWCSHFGLTPAERSRISKPVSAVKPWESHDLDGRNYG
ncbi:P27 family phage terminase small subunit [Nocardioides sp. NPDC047086]|uniref:P27 family phage terminase small subunit n=1 Tax=Nocardioides sp. NPDC047086 TaxID=3154810 RepID=UPI0033D3D9C0